MQTIGPVAEDEMILAFLSAEFHSPRFKAAIRQALGGDAAPIYWPRLNDDAENARRRQALGAVRGYGTGQYLFRNFPGDVEWYRIALTRDDLGAVMYANYPTWVWLSGGSRLVRDGAANVDAIQVPENANENIRAVARELRGGPSYPEMILVADSPGGQLVLVEGHTRATAYFLTSAPPDEIEVLAGYSASMAHWAFY
jgi:hypothetical protein